MLDDAHVYQIISLFENCSFDRFLLNFAFYTNPRIFKFKIKIKYVKKNKI